MLAQSWLIYALLSALMAALVAVFAKIGMQGIDTTLATAIRSVVMTVLLLGLCFTQNLFTGFSAVHGKALTMIVISGLAGAASWLFYFKALQVGTVAHVAPIDKLSMPLAVIFAVLLLRERPSMWNWTGIALMAIGAFLCARPAHN